MTTLALRTLPIMGKHSFFSRISLFQSLFRAAKYMQEKMLLFPNLSKEMSYFILMCKTFKRKKIKMKKHKFWKKWKAKRNTNKKNL